MNENQTQSTEVAEENNEQLEGTTPEEVAQLLHLPTPEKEESEEESEDESEEENSEESSSYEEESSDDTADEESEDEVKESQDTDGEEPTFELEVEDANGETFTLKPGDDLEKALKDFEPKSNGQIFAVLKQLSDLESQKQAYESEQATKAEEADKAERISTIQSGWDKEIATLQGSKRLEVAADGKSERVDQVFKFMNEENNKRAEDGRPFIQSFEDALDKLELRESKEAEAKKAKEEKELARKRGGMVGGSSAPATNGGPVYKGGARNSNEAIKAMGLL